MNSVWLGRVFFELRQDVVPHTVDYFVKLVTSHVAGFTIKGCRFHRIFPQICQARQGFRLRDLSIIEVLCIVRLDL